MSRRHLGDWIAEQDGFSRLKHEDFRRAAEVVATAFVSLSEAGAVSLFGSVALPLRKRATS